MLMKHQETEQTMNDGNFHEVVVFRILHNVETVLYKLCFVWLVNTILSHVFI